MNKISSFILRSCGYTVMLELVLYFILAMIGGTDQGIPVLRFLLVLLYGTLIAVAGSLYGTLTLHRALRTLIHYGILLAGFILVYSLSGIDGGLNASRLFIAAALFTMLYAAVGGIALGIGALVHKADRRIAAAAPAASKKAEPEKREYKPRFTDRDS